MEHPSAIAHLVLPRELPGETDDDDLIRTEHHLLHQFAEFLSNWGTAAGFTDSCPDPAGFGHIQKLFKTWSSIQECQLHSANDFSSHISKLEPGDSIAFYVREQNGTFLITRPPVSNDLKRTNRLRFSSFLASQSNESVLTAPGDLVTEFPGVCIDIPFSSVLKSEAFAKDVIRFRDTPYSPAMKTTKKAGNKFDENRDVARPMLVTQYMTTLLTDLNSSNCSSTAATGEFQRIRKKIRDQVVWYNSLKPFRRSGLWMSLKVVLQLELVNRFGSDPGLFLYKNLMLSFLTQRCDAAREVSDDLKHQMMAKIGRRLAKISGLVGEVPWEAQVRNFVSGQVQEVVSRISDEMEARWAALIKSYSATPDLEYPIAISPHEVEASAIHGLVHLRMYLLKIGKLPGGATSDKKNPTAASAISLPPRTRFRLHSDTWFPRKNFHISKDDALLGLVLLDFERFIYARVTVGTSDNCIGVLELLESYISVAKPYYSGDPVGASRMVLTCFKIVQLLDIMATSKYNMLLEHDSGINPGLLRDLLIPTKESAILLQGLETYFAARNSRPKLPSLIEESALSPNSFSVRYAAADRAMGQLRDRILNEGWQRCNKKMAQVEQEREKCMQWKILNMRLEHAFIPVQVVDEWGTPTPTMELQHSVGCVKCGLEHQIAECRVARYEKPLPEHLHWQNGIVFELLIPIEISTLRDALYLVSRDIFYSGAAMPQSRRTRKPYHCTLTRSPQLEPYRHPHHRRQKYVELVSTTKSTLATHHGGFLHVDTPDATAFIVNNGLNCCFGVDSKIFSKWPKESANAIVKTLCSFSTKPGSAYEGGMSRMLTGTSHTENQVLTGQAACPQKLTLAEYREFGSVRATGHRLQYRNIYRAIANETLSFQEESVINLILQSIWEAGPQAPGAGAGEFWRESHYDISQDQSFTLELLAELERFLHRRETNWNDQHVLLLVVQLTNRVVSMTMDPNCAKKGRGLLRKCRCLALQWIEAIESVLSRMGGNSPEAQLNLRLKLLQIAASGALTFANCCFSSGAEAGTEFSLWLRFIAKIDDNVLLTNCRPGKLPVFTRNLLRWVRYVGVDLEFRFQHRPVISAALNIFVQGQWSGSPLDLVGNSAAIWQQCPSPLEQWYSLACKDRYGNEAHLHMDILLGKFLVDGKPIGKLPEAITGHPDFVRTFAASIFIVQGTGSDGIFVTKDTYHGCSYKFQLRDGQLEVTEMPPAGAGAGEFVLIPAGELESDVPVLLVEGFTHWRHMEHNVVEFRAEPFLSSGFKTGVKYKLNIATGMLQEVAPGGRAVVDKNSSLHGRISRVMSRLERVQYVHIFHDPQERILSIELPRMGLHFSVGQEGQIWSEENHGYVVSCSQDVGTLVGLQHGLRFTRDHSNPVVFLPNGTPIASEAAKHQIVTIDTTELREPPFFVLEVDELLHRLKMPPSQHAWLYLAHLHALTGSVLPDPFTGLTGTESATQLLQSPLCWSCEPLHEESLRTLTAIEALSPARSWYPSHLNQMEQVVFPAAIPSTCAHDAYAFLVEKLRVDSQRMSFAFGAQLEDLVKDQSQEGEVLGRRAYWRSLQLYSPQARLTGWDKMPECVPVSSLDLQVSGVVSFDSPNLHSVRRIADLCNRWSATGNIRLELIMKSICEASLIRGTNSAPEFRLESVGFDDWCLMEVIPHWLRLYDYARTVRKERLQCEWSLMLMALAYSEPEAHEELTEHLKILQAVAVNYELFRDLNPPEFEVYENTGQRAFQRQVIEDKILEHVRQPPTDLPWENSETEQAHTERVRAAQDSHCKELDSQITALVDYYERKYGSLRDVDTCALMENAWEVLSLLQGHDNLNKAIKTIMQGWARNKELHNFVGKFVSRMLEISSGPGGKIAQPPLPELSTQVDKPELERFAKREKRDVTRKRAAPTFAEERNLLDLDLQRFKGMFAEMVEKLEPPSSQRSSPGIGRPVYPLESSVGQCAIMEEYHNELKLSWEALSALRMEKGEAFDLRLITDKGVRMQGELDQHVRNLWRELVNEMQSHDGRVEHSILQRIGLLPRVTPASLLPILCELGAQPRNHRITRIAVLWTLQQKLRRCLHCAAQGEPMQLALTEELSNFGYENWEPDQRPEWLLLQLEMDLMIRPVQVSVAERMLSSDRHSLLQLNMGEGKTAVLVPMLATRIARQGSQLPRVTVLRSLYNTNKKMLQYSIGGLLGQRVYTLPCRRDMPLDMGFVQTIQELLKECMGVHGVLMTVPEHRLSLQLKAYEMALSRNCAGLGTARALVEVDAWLRTHTQDVLDECDEILNVKYQLIYTVGEQQTVDAGATRWIVCQKILKLVPKHMQALGEESPVEVRHGSSADEALGAFPHCRILRDDEDCYQQLCIRIAKDVLRGRSELVMPENPAPVAVNRDLLLNFLTSSTGLGPEDHDKALSLFPPGSPHLHTILLIRGLLAYRILWLGLTKRWRVNYGVNAAGPRRMAVPFRAKDVPSERAEFGHTDVAILLTQLSYYYSGLSEEQVKECLQLLQRVDNRDLEYRSWVEGVRCLDPSLATLSGINLADYAQTHNVTIPTLRKNPRVIDFWLAHAVYPKESKQFPQKLMCTGWDLCSSEMRHPVTGFSGANDTRLLLPLTIAQEEVPELSHTNGAVLYNLLLPENNRYSVLPHGFTGKQLLEKLVREGIPLLLDVGALMIDLGNEAVAKEWLSLARVHDNKWKAALYFNDGNEITVMDSEGRTTPLNLSPHRSNLDACLIYLDDVHTRGTDLKIPRGTTGCVTLGKGVTKDKLVQGCMRLRMLGNGHQVGFYAPQDVDAEIRAVNGSRKEGAELGAKDVILWTLHNSCEVTRDGFQHWAYAAANYFTKMAANLEFRGSPQNNEDLERLGRSCCEDELLDIVRIYGPHRQPEPLHKVVKRQLAEHVQTLGHDSSEVVKRCRRYAGNVTRLTTVGGMDEEQERELEHEQEEERHKQRPGPATPATPVLAPQLLACVQDPTNFNHLPASWFVRLPRALVDTSVWPHVQERAWGENVYATIDFCRVVQSAAGGSDIDEYLRPVRWLVFFPEKPPGKQRKKPAEQQRKETKKEKERKKEKLVLISQFEANEVKFLFNQSRVGPGVSLHMFAPRLRPDHRTFWTTSALTVRGNHSVARTPPELLPQHQQMNANLLLFSGSLFFADKEEQDSYCALLGFVPCPRSEEEERAAAAGHIKNGWLLPNSEIRQCAFQQNPEALVHGIIKCRHETAPPQSCHVSRILLQSIKTFGVDSD